MNSIKINLVPRTPSYSVSLEDGGTALVAYANFTRPDGSFSGLGLSLQASPLIGCIAPDAADAEMFFRSVALLNAALKLLEALKSAKHMLERDFIDDAKMAVIDKCEAAIALATTHPLHNAIEAERLQEAADAANESAADDRLLAGGAA